MSTFFITNGIYRTAGTEKVIVQLAKILNEENVIIIVPSSTKVAFQMEKILNIVSADIGEFPETGILKKVYHRIKYFFWLRKYISSHKPNNILSFSFDINLLNIFLNSICRFNCIICEHIEHSYHKGIRNLIRRLFYKKKDVRLICLTETDRVKFLNEGINAMVIPNFIFPIKSDYNSDSKVILGIGRLEYQKNFSFLVKSFILSDLYKFGWVLHIYGEGSEKNNLIKIIEENNVLDFIKIYDFTKEIAKCYENSALLCMTSRFEAFPMVLLEAMNFSLPVLVTDFPTGAREILGENSQQIVYDYNEITYAKALYNICSNEELRKKLSDSNTELIKAYYPDEILQKWKQVLK